MIYCFDCDDYDNKQEDLKFLENAKQYCDSRGADFVWFCKDIERVYIGKKVDDSQKGKESAMFKAKKRIADLEAERLSVVAYRANTSNILHILDNYLTRKQST